MTEKELVQQIVEYNEKTAEGRGITVSEQIQYHQATHCSELKELREVVAAQNVALGALSMVLQRKGLVTSADILAEIEADRLEREQALAAADQEEITH
jgi:hypothetical protein